MIKRFNKQVVILHVSKASSFARARARVCVYAKLFLSAPNKLKKQIEMFVSLHRSTHVRDSFPHRRQRDTPLCTTACIRLGMQQGASLFQGKKSF